MLVFVAVNTTPVIAAGIITITMTSAAIDDFLATGCHVATRVGLSSGRRTNGRRPLVPSRTMTRPRTARALAELAATLNRSWDDTSVPIGVRRILARCAPFLEELGRQARFVHDLDGLGVRPETPMRIALAGLSELAERYRLPQREPYALRTWGMILNQAVGYSSESVPSLDLVSLLPRWLEVQLVFSGSYRQRARGRVPVIAGVYLPLERDEVGTPQARDHLKAKLREPLRGFRKKIRRLAAEGPFPSIEVRLFAPSESDNDPPVLGSDGIVQIVLRPAPDRMLGQFTVPIVPRQRLERVLNPVVDGLLDLFRKERYVVPSQGRRPDTRDDARWWAMAVFDDLSASQIAVRETDGHPDSADLANRIFRRLRQIGIGVRME